MQCFCRAVALVGCLVACSAEAQSPGQASLDFGYTVTRDFRIKPARVFNDGRDIYIEPDASQLVATRVLDVPYTRHGPYLVVQGLPGIVRIDHRGALAIVRRTWRSALAAMTQHSTETERATVAAAIAKTDCAQTNRIEEQEFEITYSGPSVRPQRVFQNKLKRIVAAATQSNVVTLVISIDAAEPTLSVQRAHYLRDLLITRGVQSSLIRVETRTRMNAVSQIVIAREVKGCGDGSDDSDTTALAKSDFKSTEDHVAPGSATVQVSAETTAKTGEPFAAPALKRAVFVPDRVSGGDKPVRSPHLTFAANASVREVLRRYLREEGIDLEWQVRGDLIVEEQAEVSGVDMKAVVTTALRRLGLKGILIAGRRLVVESES